MEKVTPPIFAAGDMSIRSKFESCCCINLKVEYLSRNIFARNISRVLLHIWSNVYPLKSC